MLVFPPIMLQTCSMEPPNIIKLSTLFRLEQGQQKTKDFVKDFWVKRNSCESSFTLLSKLLNELCLEVIEMVNNIKGLI